jgi:hypothetical protein
MKGMTKAVVDCCVLPWLIVAFVVVGTSLERGMIKLTTREWKLSLVCFAKLCFFFLISPPR